MTAKFVPTPDASAPHQRQFTTLDGVRYLLRFDWGARAGLWYLGIYTEAGVPLAVSLPLVLGSTVVSESAKRREPRLPQGVLFCHDLRQSAYPLDAGVDELHVGGRVRLTYVPRADL